MSDTDARLAEIEKRLARIEEQQDRILNILEAKDANAVMAARLTNWEMEEPLPPGWGYIKAGDSPKPKILSETERRDIIREDYRQIMDERRRALHQSTVSEPE